MALRGKQYSGVLAGFVTIAMALGVGASHPHGATLALADDGEAGVVVLGSEAEEMASVDSGVDDSLESTFNDEVRSDGVRSLEDTLSEYEGELGVAKEPAVALDAQGTTYTTSNGVQYEINSGVVTITGYTGNATSLNLSNLGIGVITRIESYAFDGCSKLTSVTLPSTLQHIGAYAFRGCTKLSSLVLPESLTHIDGGAFLNCTGLTSLTVNSRSLSVSSSDLFGNAGTSGSGMAVTFSSSCQRVPNYFFSPYREGAAKVTRVTIAQGVSEIGYEAFQGLTTLSSASLPSSVMIIDDYAFDGCLALASVTLPSTLQHIGAYAFRGCTKLSSLVLPESLTQINGGAFLNCTGLTSLTVNSRSLSVSSSDVFGNAGTGGSGISVTFSSSCQRVPNYFFSPYREGAAKVTKVTVAKGVNAIGYEAFQGLSTLSSVSLPSSVTSIDSYAFDGCTGLKKLALPTNLPADNIGSYAFRMLGLSSTITVSNADQYLKLSGNDYYITPSRTTVVLEGVKTSPFSDVYSSTPHYDDILWLYASGITTGYGDGTYRPSRPVSRQDMAAFLFRLAKLKGVVDDYWSPSYSQRYAFSDVSSNTPHSREIWWLASVGISTGYSNGTFRPTRAVSRQDMAAFLFRLAKLCGRGGATNSWSPTYAQRTAFPDVTSSTSHSREIWWLASVRVTTGYGDGTFRPGRDVSRQDMAAFLHRLFDL